MAQELSSLVSTSVPELFAETQDPNMGLQERCPACGAVVPWEDITSAVCANGHTWGTSSCLRFLNFPGLEFQLINRPAFLFAIISSLTFRIRVGQLDARSPRSYFRHPWCGRV